MPAILFGSISTIADTSELQREAFNAAFVEHGLDWNWTRDEYVSLLQSNGGERRIADYAAERGENVDAAAVHESKSRLFQEKVAAGVAARPGVVDTIRSARSAGDRIALVTTTSGENLTALFGGLRDVSADEFDLITDSSSVDEHKPDKAVYAFALHSLGEDASSAVAIEDNVGGVASAKAAGVRTVAFPNENTAAHDFGAADERVEALAFEHLHGPTAAA
jgi:HAD superfamily hydrolase (TIGR01509 family)